MNLDKFDQPLTDYLNSLSLSSTQDMRITSALENILSIVLAEYPDAQVYAQGSYSTDTMVKPLTAAQSGTKGGDYDIDIAIEREDWNGAAEALEAVLTVIEADGVYGQMSIDNTKNSCIRIEYARDGSGVGFHIDLVPTKFEKGIRFAPDRENDSWKHSDAKQFTDWFNDLADNQPGIRSISIIIKRLRDLVDLTGNLKSIVILTLIGSNYYANGTLMGDLLAVVGEVANIFSADNSITIPNPVNQGEDLVDTISDFNEVKDFTKGVATDIKEGVIADDADKLSDLFGPGFSYSPAKQSSIAAAPQSVRPTQAYGVSDNAEAK